MNFGAADRRDRDRRRGRRSNGGKPGEQRVLLDLGDQAVVIGSLSIPVEEMVKLGRNRQSERCDPQQKHQTGDTNPAASARTP
ncbi:MAG: hypothetical protein ABSD29_03825 [Verrucomicrobiota bacterium]